MRRSAGAHDRRHDHATHRSTGGRAARGRPSPSSRSTASSSATAAPRCVRGIVASPSSAASCSACSARTAPARRPPSRSSRACAAPTPARCRVLGLDPARGRRPAAPAHRRASCRTPPCPTACGSARRCALFASLHPTPRPTDELVEEWQLGRTSCGDPSPRCRAASASGCSSRSPSSAAPSSCSSTSSPRTSTRSAAATRGTSSAASATRARPSCWSPTTSRRPSGCATASSSWTAAGSSPTGSPAAIVAELGGSSTVRFTDADLDVRTLRTLPGVDGRAPPRARGPRGGHRTAARPRRRPPRRRRPPALDLRVDRPSLEERFVALTEEDHAMTAVTAVATASAVARWTAHRLAAHRHGAPPAAPRAEGRRRPDRLPAGRPCWCSPGSSARRPIPSSAASPRTTTTSSATSASCSPRSA